MRVVAALGGNALLTRGERPDADPQEHHVRAAVAALAPVARQHQLVLTHGNGPQVGLLAQESARDPDLTRPYPFDTLVAQTQGMIGYWLAQAVDDTLGHRPTAAVVCRTLVDPSDPAFAHPTKFVGPPFDEVRAGELSRQRGWHLARDGDAWRRVVPSPEPEAVVELPVLRALVEAGTLVICAGGGGVPVVRTADGSHRGVEAVVDKDLTAALVAWALEADVLALLTDVASVQRGFGTAAAAPMGETTPAALRAERFPPGSMGPKVEAACRFVERTGGRAAIGALAEAAAVVAGSAGTQIRPD